MKGIDTGKSGSVRELTLLLTLKREDDLDMSKITLDLAKGHSDPTVVEGIVNDIIKLRMPWDNSSKIKEVKEEKENSFVDAMFDKYG